jgi:hypothetical protein
VPIAYLSYFRLLLLGGIIVVVLLGQLPFMDRGLQQRRQAVAVFQPSKEKTLTDDNLVDAMANLPLRDQLMKVSWDHAILTVDLLGTQPDEVWKDMEQLILYSYAEVHNVRQVLIRVFKVRAENRTLLLAAETRKSECTEKELSELQPSAFLMDSEFISKIRLSITPSGQRWITNFSN